MDGSNHHAVAVNGGEIQLIPGSLCQLAEIQPLDPAITFTERMQIVDIGIEVRQLRDKICTRQATKEIHWLNPGKHTSGQGFDFVSWAEACMLLAQVNAPHNSGPLIQLIKQKPMELLIIIEVQRLRKWGKLKLEAFHTDDQRFVFVQLGLILYAQFIDQYRGAGVAAAAAGINAVCHDPIPRCTWR